MSTLVNKNVKKGKVTHDAGRFLSQAHDNILKKENLVTIFSLDGNPLIGEDFQSPTGLLPVLIWYADKVHENIVGFPFGVAYKVDDRALTGYRLHLEKITESFAEVILYLTEALYDAKNALPKCKSVPGAVAIGGLVQAFKNDMQNQIELKTKNAIGNTPS